MKIKSYLLSALFAVTLFSCSKNDDSSSEKEILGFNSEKEMQNKIAEIVSFKKNQETQIIGKILTRNNVKAPSADDLKELEKASATATIDKKALLEDVKFYHTERLNAIYAERSYFNFTSIQSIADEINSLQLLNPEKAEELSNKHASFLKKSGTLTSPVYENAIALVLSANGQLILNNKIFSPQKNNDAGAKLLLPEDIKQGVLATNGFFSVTWHVGVSEHRDDIGHTYYGNFAQFGGFINNVLYPTWFYPTSNSNERFVKPGTINPVIERFVGFPTSAGTIVKNDDANSLSKSYYNKYLPMEGFVSGTFVTIINGQYVVINGAKTIN